MLSGRAFAATRSESSYSATLIRQRLFRSGAISSVENRRVVVIPQRRGDPFGWSCYT